MFQSSPASKGRCNPVRCAKQRTGQLVSILTGLERPVQLLPRRDATGRQLLFQSSPASKGRCNRQTAELIERIYGFNPHRPRKAGATYSSTSIRFPADMFQSSPASKGRCNFRPRGHLVAICVVSILTGLERPVQPDCIHGQRRPTGGFNPHRPRKAGATTKGVCTWRVLFCFNPHRPRKAGATLAPAILSGRIAEFQSSPASKGRCNFCQQTVDNRGGVSILTGLERPVQRPVVRDPYGLRLRFQSSPASKGRCNSMRSLIYTNQVSVSILTGLERPVQRASGPRTPSPRWWFQSSPASKGRCNIDRIVRPQAARAGFNPHRPRKAGATAGRCRFLPPPAGFNPHRPRKAGATA